MTEQPEQLMFHGREIAMTPDEKTAMRRKLLAYTLSNPSRVAVAFSAWSWVRRHAVMSTAFATVLALGATGVSANMAGPNDVLYGFRLQVNDRIESAIVFDDEAQFDVEFRQIERQLDAEESAFDKALADDEQDGVEAIETPEPEKLNRNNKESKDEGYDAANDELESELRQMERELQQEESAAIELGI